MVIRRLETEPAGGRRERLLAVRLGLAGELGLAQIANAVGRSRATIQTWFDTYRQGGVDALLYDARNDNPGRPSELSGLALVELQKDLENGRWRSVPQVQRWLAQTHGIQLALSSLYDRLGKVGARLRVPRKSHCKKDPAASVEFRTELASKLMALALPASRPVRLWVLDEMRYGLHGFTRRVWGLPNFRPVVPTQQKYQWGFVYGAGFHLRDGDAHLPDNVRIITLPAYSPELNPIEGLWDQVKDGLCNKVFDTLAELEVVLRDKLQRFWRDARRVHSLFLTGSSIKQTVPLQLLYYIINVDCIN